MARKDDDIGEWIEGEGNHSLAVAGWGLAGVTAFVLAFASWQYAPVRSPMDSARNEVTFDPSDVTGSIGGVRGATPVTVGAGRAAPSPLGGSDTVATSRDIEKLRGEIRDLQRRIALLDVASSDAGRRLAQLEAKAASASAGVPMARGETPAEPSRPVAAIEPPADKTGDKPAEKSLDRLADKGPDRLPMPQPKPGVDLAATTPPAVAFDGDGPATTGAVPKPAPTAAAPKSSRLPPAPTTTATVPPTPGRSDAAANPTPPASAPTPVRSEAVASPTPQDFAPAASAAPMPLAPPAAATTEPAPAPSATVSATAPTPSEPAEVDTAARPVRVVSTRPPEPVVPPAAAPSAPTAERAAIDLGGYRSLASLRRSWSDMSKRWGDLSKGVEPLARLKETDTGIEARLVAGPFADPTEAAKVCFRLKAAGAPCTVTVYGGQPLAAMR